MSTEHSQTLISYRIEWRSAPDDQWALLGEYNRIDPARAVLRTGGKIEDAGEYRLLEVTTTYRIIN